MKHAGKGHRVVNAQDRTWKYLASVAIMAIRAGQNLR